MQTEFPERYITLGLKIAYYRKKAGLTQEVLAERIGKSVNFVGQVEGTGTIRGVSLETLFKIAQVLKSRPPSCWRTTEQQRKKNRRAATETHPVAVPYCCERKDSKDS